MIKEIREEIVSDFKGTIIDIETIGDFNGIAVSPPQDSVQEFKVMSGVFSAEYGRTGGAVVIRPAGQLYSQTEIERVEAI